MDYMAKVRSKGLDATGVTENIARSMFSTLGGHTMAIIELKHVKQSTDAEGKHSVELVITTLEPATDDRTANHLRELARGLYRTRPEVEGQEVLKGVESGEPAVEDIVTQGDALIERDEDGNPVGVWDADVDETPQDAAGSPDNPALDGWATGYPEGPDSDSEASNVVAFSNGG